MGVETGKRRVGAESRADVVEGCEDCRTGRERWRGRVSTSDMDSGGCTEVCIASTAEADGGRAWRGASRDAEMGAVERERWAEVSGELLLGKEGGEPGVAVDLWAVGGEEDREGAVGGVCVRAAWMFAAPLDWTEVAVCSRSAEDTGSLWVSANVRYAPARGGRFAPCKWRASSEDRQRTAPRRPHNISQHAYIVRVLVSTDRWWHTVGVGSVAFRGVVTITPQAVFAFVMHERRRYPLWERASGDVGGDVQDVGEKEP